MGASSNEALPLGGGTGPKSYEAIEQNSFERFTNEFNLPTVAGRSVR